MIISVPVLLIIGPLAAAGIALAMRRWRAISDAVGTVLVGLLWLWLRFLPLDEMGSVLIYGRSLTFTEGVRSMFLFVLAGVIVLFLLSFILPQGRFFVPGSLAVLSPFAAMLMIRPFSFGVLFWLIAATLLAVIIHSEQAGLTQAALRYLIMMVLVVPLLLVAEWMLEMGQGGLYLTAGRLLVLSFIILLGGFPFHIWVRPIAAAAASLSMILVFSLAQLVATLFIYALLSAYPWVQQEPSLVSLLGWSSGLAALTAGLLAVTAMDYGRLIGSLLLLDMSVSLALLTVPLAVGQETAVALPIVRFISLLLVAVGLGRLRLNQDGTGFMAYRGLGRQEPVVTAVLVFGVVSLLGLPLTVGFAGRWGAIILVAQELPIVAVTVLLAMGGGIIGVWRGISPMLVVSGTDVGSINQWQRLILAVGLIGAICLTTFPQVIHFYVGRLVNLWLPTG